MSKSKKWVLLFLALLFVGIGAYMGLNYYANPLGYFTNIRGEKFYYSDDYSRSIKSAYVMKHKDEIEGAVIGGSKAGAISTDLLEELTGLHYYNFYVSQGNFLDYMRYTRFLVEDIGVKEITLQLSSFEFQRYDRTNLANNYHVPAILTGNLFKQIQEFASYLMTDVSTLWRELTTRPKRSLAKTECVVDGMRNWCGTLATFQQDPDRLINRRVLRKYNANLKKLFTKTRTGTREIIMNNTNALREIVSICKKNNVKLRIFIGASGLNEKCLFEGSAYYSYLAALVSVAGEIWDFSDYNDINMNPYNSFDQRHYSYEVADLMVRTMLGVDSREGFGILLTPRNVHNYLAKRQEDFQALKKEYETTGTVALQGMSDDSFLPWRTDWTGSKEATQLRLDTYGGISLKDEMMAEDETETEEEEE